MTPGGIEKCWNQKGSSGDRSCAGLAERIHCRNCPVYSSAAKSLLDRGIPDPYRDSWTTLVAVPKAAADGERTSVVVFRTGTEWLGVPVHLVREITPLHKIHSLPHRSSRGLLGIVNIRGELQLCVSLRGLFGLSRGEEGAICSRVSRRMIVLERGRDRWVCPADEVQGVQRMQPAQIKGLPATVGRSAARFTRGVVVVGDRNIGLIDEDLLIDALKRATG